MKWAFQLALYDRAKADERIHLVIGDVGAVMFQKFRADFPDRFINAGLREQAMVSFAAGMAMEGLRPIVYTITPFLLERAFEQIKLDVDQMNMPVGLVGYSDNSAGPTHSEMSTWPLNWPFKNITPNWTRDKAVVTKVMQTIDLDRPWFLGMHG